MSGQLSSPPFSTEVRVHAVERPDENVPMGTLPVVLGTDASILYDRLEGYCFAQLTPLDIDLLVVAATVAFVDRHVRRRSRVTWARRLALSIPVHEPRRWSHHTVRTALHEFLRYGTGDHWELDFRQRNAEEPRALQLPLISNFDTTPSRVLAYSAGLDSFAELQLLRQDSDAPPPVLVTAEQDTRICAAVEDTVFAEGAAAAHVIGVPIKLSPGRHPEETYRTRMVLFLSAAAVACRLSGAQEIVIAENGQGAIGPSLVTLANEHPYRATYPGFSARFRDFIGALWQAPAPTVVHPRLWQTKGEVLGLLRSREILGAWRRTSSCSRQMERAKGSGTAASCGFCGNCLLRRQAVFVAGLEPEDDRYYLRDLNAQELQEGLSSEANPEDITDVDREVARVAVLDLEFLAREASQLNKPKHVRIADECARALGVAASSAREQLKRLLRQHQKEWNAFMDSLASDAWVLRTARGV